MAPRRVSFEAARLALAHLEFDGERERDAALARAARICSGALAVERVGVWLMAQGRSQLVCPDLFVRSEAACRVGETIALDTVPAYRAALEARKVIVADDAQHAPATRELTGAYLGPLGITSMLSATVFRDGEVVGVVCLEHVGPGRTWSDAESAFASSVADLVGMLFEHTARRAAERELRDRIADETDQHRHALIGQIAAGIAHDFANIMQGVSLAASELADAGDVERERLLAGLARWTSSGVALVQQLRRFSMAPPSGEHCEVAQVLAQLEPMLALLCKGIVEFRLELEPGPSWAPITRTNLERVVFNLVLNARDAAEGNGHIVVRLRSAERGLAIEIRDDGAGISEELLVHVFRPYFTTKAHGTGLGLATVRAIVDAAGGSITATSVPGAGSCFTMFLPRTAHRPDAPRPRLEVGRGES